MHSPNAVYAMYEYSDRKAAGPIRSHLIHASEGARCSWRPMARPAAFLSSSASNKAATTLALACSSSLTSAVAFALLFPFALLFAFRRGRLLDNGS